MERLPLAIAWNASADSSRLFYSLLTQGKSLNETLGLVRLETQRVCQEQGEICALPVLYAKSDQLRIFDPQRSSEVALAIEGELQPLPGMTEGYAKRFVDRRMDLQRLGSALREGTIRTLIITGPDGAGKSALGTKLAIKLASLGYSLMTIYSSLQNPINAARLMEAVIALFAAAGQAEAAQRLRDPALPLAKRQKIMLDELKRGRILLFLDGLELDSQTGRIKDPELAAAYLQMLPGMESSRAIFTSRDLPADAMTLPARAREWPLAGLPEAAFVKFLLDDEAAAERYRRGEIPYRRLQEAHSSVAGSPACLAQISQALGGDGKSGTCEVALAKLASSVDPQSLLALRKASAFGIAVSPEGLAAATGLPEDQALAFARDWQRASLAYQVGSLWAVPSPLRARLFMALGLEQRLAAQRAAASFLWDLAESGRSKDLGLSRLDCLLEARGHYLAAEDLAGARAVTDRISGFLERRGYYLELIRLNQELLEREKHAEPMDWIARAYLDQGDLGRAQEWYGRAVAAGPNAAAFHGLGTCYLRQGKLDLARESFQKAAEICRSAGDLAGEAAALHGLASVDMEKKDDEAALEKLQKVAAIQEQLGDPAGMASTLQELAGLDLQRQDREAARQSLVRSLEILQRLNDRMGEAAARYRLASLDLERGEFDAARQQFQKALALRRDLGDLQGEAAVLHSLGSIEAQSGDWEKAREKFLDALRIYQQLGDRPGEAGAFFQLGALAVQKEKIQEGLRLMALSAVILRSIKSEEVRNVEPLVERLASQLHYSQEQFMAMVQEVFWGYRQDKGWGLVERAFAKK
ncbi:Tetratricopeptide repeat protein [uncultured archaeon]|nr:Tetratricopeptide repeat protein [uncultured archaeon]